MTIGEAWPRKPEGLEIELKPEDFNRGERFVDGLIAIKNGMKEIQVHAINAEHYIFYDGFIMVVQPQHPIFRKLVGVKYHKGPEVVREDTTSELFSIASFLVTGLYDRTNRDMLEIKATGPTWQSNDPYLAHYWQQEYTFDPREHKIAILDTSQA